MNIAFLYNVKHNAPSLDPAKQIDAEFDEPKTINAIQAAIESLGHKVIPIEADLDAYEKLKNLKGKIDLVFNIAEGLGGDARESQIPIFCEMLGIAYTHSKPSIHALKLNKQFTKDVLEANGILVPHSEVLKKEGSSLSIRLNFPLILKPNLEGSSKGIYDKNVVSNESDLTQRLSFMFREFRTEILVEEFIDGREFTVALLGEEPEILPIIEQRFDFLPQGFKKIASYELKWLYEDTLKDPSLAYFCPANLAPQEKKEIDDTSLRVWKTLELLDAARIDFRMDNRGRLYFLEVNSLPGINPDEKVISYFPLAARKAGYTFPQMIDKIIKSASKRWGIS